MKQPFKPFLAPRMTDKIIQSYGGYDDTDSVSLQQLLDWYKDCDFNKVIIDGCFNVCRPETDEEYNLRVKDYEHYLKVYENELEKYNKQFENPSYKKIKENGWSEGDMDLE